MTQTPALLWAATPDPKRTVTLVELTSCLTCSRILERCVRDEHGRSEPYEGAGEYEWLHRESRAVECDEQDVARPRRVQDGGETPVDSLPSPATGKAND